MDNESNRRLARNTLLLYLRMFIVILINLYTSRVILAALGVDDYGIYNVVGGVVAMFVFLNTAMVASSQRFIAFEQGRNDIARQKLVYSTSVLIHISIALVVLLLAETVGLWFLNHKLNIAQDRMPAANWVYQSAIACFLLKILIVPDTSSVIAHERMGIYAVANVTFAVLQMLAAISLKSFGGDRLVLYSILLVCVEGVNFCIYKFFCRRRFAECRYAKPEDPALFKEMLSFAGWSFVGNFGIALRGPGVNVVINLFCGTAVNAARGIAYQVSSVVNNFVNSFQMALTPQITKNYAAGEKSQMSRLVLSGSRISFFLLACIVVPLYIRAEPVLGYWLEEVPAMSSYFLRLVLLVSLVNSMVGPITTALQATGKIMVFQIVIAVIMLAELPLAYLALSLGLVAYKVVFISLFIEFVALIARIILLNAQVGIKVGDFLFGMIVKCIAVFVVMFMPAYLVNGFFPDSFIGLAVLSAVSVLWSALVVLTIGLTKEERHLVFAFFKRNR